MFMIIQIIKLLCLQFVEHLFNDNGYLSLDQIIHALKSLTRSVIYIFNSIMNTI